MRCVLEAMEDMLCVLKVVEDMLYMLEAWSFPELLGACGGDAWCARGAGCHALYAISVGGCVLRAGGNEGRVLCAVGA